MFSYHANKNNLIRIKHTLTPFFRVAENHTFVYSLIEIIKKTHMFVYLKKTYVCLLE